MRVEIGYNLESLQAAARFIWDNNPSVPKWPNPPKNIFELMKQIKAHVYRDVKANAEVLRREKAEGINLSDNWVNMTGTGGYTVLYSLEDQKDDWAYITVEFLVDANVGKDGTYVTEMIDELDETV